MTGKNVTRGLIVLGFLLSLALVMSTALASNGYETHWWTVDGGGGTSTGGTYVLSGTTGQADAGLPLVNGDYVLYGGFWGGAALAGQYRVYLPLVMHQSP